MMFLKNDISVPTPTRLGKKRLVHILLQFLQMFYIFDLIKYMFIIKFTTINDFVMIIELIVCVLLVTVNLYMPVLDSYILSKLYGRINEMRKGTSEDEDGLISIAFFIMYILIAATLGTLLFHIGSSNGYYFTTEVFIGTMASVWYIIKVANLKCLIGKRIRAVSSDDNVDQVITDTRKILACNTDLNSSSQLFVVMYQLWVFIHLLKYPYNTWRIFVMQISDPNAFESYPVSAALFNCGIFLTVLTLGCYSSILSDRIECLKTMLDHHITMNPGPKANHKLVSTFLLELHYTPVELTASGLFKINQAAITIAFWTVISYTMVFIQFS